ncbi:response regulator [Candidatus Magnetominusculus xianensis]|uniref:Response regulatory domain-containing protein n=1 Tax=Candidatus Magnetominusculus xianensis TaxID=1748249 RepID=A0ABR5SE39_9BACT|nr:response regulator [Candidatus Magnetominusculus xianensis]KWT81168.1 hypothetical protein ASN18_2592 [Candidatus Magnetominusculus xianensis]MBF0404318.1 hypothetical protein [Nitrospirota bacterium]
MPADTNENIDEKTALICDDSKDRQEEAAESLDDLGYKVQTAESPDDAYERVKHNQFDIIYLHANFGGGNPESNEVLEFIQSMPMSARRKIFVVLAGASYTTNDNMKAYSESANVVINEADMREFKQVLKKSVTANNMFYKVYNEMLRAVGKA